MKYSVEVMRVREQTIQLNGWAVENDPDSVITYRIEDEAGNPVDAKIVPTRRDDVSQIYYKKIIDRDLSRLHEIVGHKIRQDDLRPKILF